MEHSESQRINLQFAKQQLHMTVGFLRFCVIPENLPLLKAYLGIENAPAEAGAQPDLHHRIFKQVFDIATKNTG